MNFSALLCSFLQGKLNGGLAEKLSKTEHKWKQTMSSDNTESNMELCWRSGLKLCLCFRWAKSYLLTVRTTVHCAWERLPRSLSNLQLKQKRPKMFLCWSHTLKVVFDISTSLQWFFSAVLTSDLNPVWAKAEVHDSSYIKVSTYWASWCNWVTVRWTTWLT